MVTEPARLILVTVFPGVDAFDVAAPAEVFTVANQVLPPGRAHYEIRYIGPTREAIRTMSGLRIQADLTWEELRERPDTVIVSGRMDVGPDGPVPFVDPDVVSWLAGICEEAVRVAAVCAGTHRGGRRTPRRPSRDHPLGHRATSGRRPPARRRGRRSDLHTLRPDVDQRRNHVVAGPRTRHGRQ
jgi:hypothetical protein